MSTRFRKFATWRATLPILLAVAAMLVVARVVSHDLQYRVDHVEFLLSATAAGRVEVFYQLPPVFRGFVRERTESVAIEAGGLQQIRVYLRQVRASWMLFRFTGQAGALTIHRLAVRRWYGGDIIVAGVVLAGFLEPVQGGTRIAVDPSGARLAGGPRSTYRPPRGSTGRLA